MSSKQSKLSEYELKYKEIELIGRGTQGSAMLVECKQDKKRYVSKKVILTNLSEKDQKNAIQELKLLREMKHPNIVKFIESYKEKNKVIIIMEYCEYGDLSKLIKDKSAKGEQVDENMILQWFIQICSALNFIHSKKVIHRDIKSSNIFLTKSNCVKIGDFGISKQLENSMDKANTVVGTPYYLSPEVCQNKPYTFKSDMWSLGCVIYELCALKHPFQSNSLMSLVMKIATEKTPKIPQNYSLMISGFIRSLLQKIPEKRPSAQDILNNQSIKKLMKEFVQQQQEIVNDIQNMKQIMISKGASQGEITLMEKQLQERIQKQQEQIKAQIQAQSQLINNESAKKTKQNQSNLANNKSKQSYNQSQQIKNESEKRESLSITKKEQEIQQQLYYLQSEVMKSYQRLSTPQNSDKKTKSSQCFKDSDITIKSEMLSTSSNKKGKQIQQIQEAGDYSDGENTIQSIAVSQFEKTNKRQIVKSNASIVSQQNKNDQLENTVKSFIAEDSQEYHTSSLGQSKEEQNKSSVLKNDSQQTETNSQFYTSSEGERESDSDNYSEKYTPCMALDLVQNESILLSKFLVENDKTLDQTNTLVSVQQNKKEDKKISDIQEYSLENPVIFGSRQNQNQNNDNFTETSVSLNVSLTQDSVFLKSKLGLNGNTILQNNLINMVGKSEKDESQIYQKNNLISEQESDVKEKEDNENMNNQFKLEKNENINDNQRQQSKNSEESEEYYEDDFEEYEDDFEEYKEDEDDQQCKTRSSQNFDCHFLYESDEEKYEDDYDQLDDILSIYKDQIGNENQQMSQSLYKFDLTEIIEESLENSTVTQKSSQSYKF